MKLIIKNADGSQKTLDIAAGKDALHVPAKPGATYQAVDAKTGKTAKTTVVKRVNDDLVIEDNTGSDASVAQIDNFFSECTPSDRCWATFSAPDDVVGGAGTVTITQDAGSMALLSAGNTGGMANGQALAFASNDGGLGFGTFGTILAGAAGIGLAMGGAGGGGGGGGGGAPNVEPLTVKGQVAAGPVKTGTVDVYVYDKDGNLLGHSLVTTDKGNYEIVIPGMGNYTGPLLLVARDANGAGVGNYIDEATHQLTDLALSLAAVGNADSDTTIINITPLTQLAAMKMGVDVNAMSGFRSAGPTMKPPSDMAMIERTNHAVGEFFGVNDILGPVVTINESDFRSADADAAAYGVALARLSEMDMSRGGIASSVEWLDQMLTMSGNILISTDNWLPTIETDRTIPREVDSVAADTAAAAAYRSAINISNADEAHVIIALPVNAVVGDIVVTTLNGTAGSVSVAPHQVTAQELAQGYAEVMVTREELEAVGTGTVVPNVYVTDEYGNNASLSYTGTAFQADVVAPEPTLAVAAASHGTLNAAGSSVPVTVSYAGMVAGDTVQLKIDGTNLGAAHVVSASEAAAGTLNINVPKSSFGADGNKTLTADVTDPAGNVGSTDGNASVSFRLDTTVPVPALALHAGDDAYLNAVDTQVRLDLTWPGMEAGDRVQLVLSGASLGGVYTVTSADANAGSIVFTVPKSSLGADGLKNVVANVTDVAGNAANSNTIALTVDNSPPAPVITIAAGEDQFLNVSETSVHVDVRYPGLGAGDTIQLKLAGNDLGTPYVVTSNDVLNGSVTLTIPKASLGGDGTKSVTVAVIDPAGNGGTSAPLSLIVDSTASVPTLNIAPGEDRYLNAAETAVHLEVAFNGMVAGNSIQLQVNGASFGTPYIVTGADVTNGFATITVLKTDLGGNGSTLAAVVANGTAANAGASNPIELIVDGIAPAPVLAVAPNEDALLGAAETALHLRVTDADMKVGDVIQLKLAGANLYAPYTVTSNDVVNGYATLTVNKADLGGDGTKNLSIATTDAAGNSGTSNVLPVTVDGVAPTPQLVIAIGEDDKLNASEALLHVRVSDASLAEGDVVQIKLAGNNLGSPHTVTAADITTGFATLAISRASLGADGAKGLTATVTDAAGNAGTSNGITVTLDSSAPTPTLTLHAGENALLNAAETAVHFDVSYPGLAAGDVIQLKLGAADLYAPYTVTANDVTNGHAELTINKVDIGLDGLKNFSVTATDVAGNAGTSNVIGVTLDTLAPSPVLAVAPGENATIDVSETGVHLRLSYPGLSAGDTIQLNHNGPLGASYTVTSADALTGYATLFVGKTDLGADGVKNITATVTDQAGNAATTGTLAITLDSVTPDTTAPTPILSIAIGEDAILGSNDNLVNVRVDYPGLVAGDVLQLKLAGGNLGSPYTVTSADVTAGNISLPILRTALGPDGVKNLSVTATDAANNVGTSNLLAITLDTAAPLPSVSVKLGEDGIVNASEPGVNISVSYPELAAGDVIQLKLAGANLGSPYTVTSADVTAGGATILVAKVSLGNDGAKNITATATDLAGNTGTSQLLQLVLDTVGPTLQFSNNTGSQIVGAGLGLLGIGKTGVALIDNATSSSDTVGQLTLALSGFADGSTEQFSIGGTTLRADGGNAPASLTASGKVWNVAYANGSYTFTPASGTASSSDVATLMQVNYNDVSANISGGQRQFSFTATDDHGNTGNTVTASVLVSVTPPSLVPTITGLSNDTGIANDFITTAASQSVSGTYSGIANLGDKIQVSLDGTNWVDATITGASSWTANGITLQSGTHDLHVRAINLAGNASTPSTQAYTLESATTSTTATIGGASDDAATNGSATGSIANASSTDDTTPTLTGTLNTGLASGQVVAVYDNGVRLGTAVVNGTNWTFTPSLAVSAGTNSFTAVVESPASGAHGAASSAFVIYEQSVSISINDDVGILQGVVANNGITDDSAPRLTGTLGGATLGAGEVVAVYDGTTKLGNATVNGTSWSYDFSTPLADGAHTLRAVIQDSANTTLANGFVISASRAVTVNTSALAPTQTVTITGAADDDATRGSTITTIANDSSTDDRTPVLAGTVSATLDANQIVVIYDNGTRLGEAVVNGTSWTFATGTLPVGTHSFVAIAESASSGARGTASSAFVIREQSITVTEIEDNVGVDIGTLLNLSLTDDSTPTMKGTIGTALGANEVVAVYDGSTKIGVAVVNGTNWTFTPTNPLTDGLHSLKAMVEDAAGGATDGRVVSDTSTVTVLTLLSTPAQTVTITSASENNAANGSVTGSFASGTSTDGTTPVLAGTLNSGLNLGEQVAVYDGATRVGYAIVNGTSWTYTSATLSAGSHSFTAQVENLVSGAQGNASNAYVVIEQSIAAAGLLDNVGATQGQIAASSITDDSTPTFSGTLATGTLGTNEVVAVYDGTTLLGNATVNGTGWSFTTSSLADGSHTLRAVVEDATSHAVHAATGSTTFTVNTSALVPTQTTTITGAIDDVGTLTGSFATNTSTDDTTPTFSGTISSSLVAGQAVALYDGSTRLGYANVNGTNWSYTSSNLSIGSHSITAVVENQATGSQGPVSTAFVVNEQSLAIDNLLGLTGAVQVLIGGLLNIVLGPSPNFTGSLGSSSLGANEVVAVYDGSTKLGHATVNGNAWGFTPTSPLSTGFHQINVVIQDAASTNIANARVSATAANLTVDLGLLVPTQMVTIDWAIESNNANGSVTGQFASGTSTDASTPSIGGSLSSTLNGAQVVAVYDGATKLGNAIVTNQSWSFTTPTLAAGTHTLTARVENPSTGSSGTPSGSFILMQQSLATITATDDVGTITGSVTAGGFTDDKRPTFSGTLGSAGLGLLETVALYDTVNGVTTKLGDAVVNGTSWSFTPLFLFPMADGAHSVKAVIQPLLSFNSNGTVVSPAINFTIDSSTQPLQILSINSVTDTLALGGSLIGSILSGGTLDDQTPTINGTLSGALTGAQAVAVYDGNVKLGYATIDVNNPLKFSYTPGTELSAGTHTLTARVENTATGSQGALSGVYVINERPLTLEILDNAGALQGNVLGFDTAVTNDTSLTLQGTIGTALLLSGINLPLEQVRVYDNGSYLGNATVTNGTNWSYNLTGLSNNSHHDIGVKVTDILGLTYSVATGGSFDVKTNELATTDASGYSGGTVKQFTLDGGGNSLDLTKVSGASQPQMDVITTGINTAVKLALADVLTSGSNQFNAASGWAGVNGTGKHQMVIDAQGAGTVNVTDGTWSAQGTTTHNGQTYAVYEDSTHLAQLLINAQLARSGTVS